MYIKIVNVMLRNVFEFYNHLIEILIIFQYNRLYMTIDEICEVLQSCETYQTTTLLPECGAMDPPIY